MKLNIAAAGIILKNKKILLLKRAKNSKLFADYWGLVGGKIASEEESLIDTAKREVKEETDLEFEPNEHFYFAETFIKDVHNIGHAFLGDWKGNVKINPAEHSEYGWFTYEETLKLPLAFNTKEIIDLLHSRRLI